jgi:formylmethanofuran dehydrogenase subunit C
MKISLHTQPDVPLEAEAISTDRLAGLSERDINALPLSYGNRTVSFGEFFSVTGALNGTLEVEGDLSRVKYLGAGMTSGLMLVEGNVGTHLGAAMSGGNIEVSGNGGDWVGSEMSGGRITVKGDAGHLVGAAIRGARQGISGGDIIVHGNAGNEVGNAMRRGLIAIGGRCGDFTGVGLLAGTIIVLGELGVRTGAGMKRGSIVSMCDAELLPTFSYACSYRPTFLSCYLLHLQRLGLPVDDDCITGRYRRWSGDNIEQNRGEILLYES